MSLVGTRPPTVDEWEKYELHHRSRMSTKPGITGMWQVSGRSDITDFGWTYKTELEDGLRMFMDQLERLPELSREELENISRKVRQFR